MVSQNLETSSARKQDKRHKSRKEKINSPSSSPEMKRRRNRTKKETKKRRKKSRSRWEKKKRPPSSSLSSSSSSSSPSTESKNEIVMNSNAISHRAWKNTDEKSSRMKSTGGTRTEWFCENTVGFPNSYHDWSPNVSFRKKNCRLWVRYHDFGKDWKIFETILMKLLRYL